SVIATSPPCHGRSPFRASAVLSPKLFAEPSGHYPENFPQRRRGKRVAGTQPWRGTLLSRRPSQRMHAMAKDISREEEQRGTEKVLFWGAAIALVLFVSLVTIALIGTS
ncbi:hypothetical protein NKI79_30050, partial [Mesorhizobium sp. M0340]